MCNDFKGAISIRLRTAGVQARQGTERVAPNRSQKFSNIVSAPSANAFAVSNARAKAFLYGRFLSFNPRSPLAGAVASKVATPSPFLGRSSAPG